MRKLYIIILIFFTYANTFAQVTQIYTDYNNFWTSAYGSLNSIKPDLSHNALAFKFNGTVYSTGVNDAKLTANGVTFMSTRFRALPINVVPISTAASYFIGFGQLTDGVNGGVTNTAFPAITTGQQKAAYLTDGPQGLNLGTCLTNIPSTTLTFNLSANGVSLSAINDGVPDILVSQIAQADTNSDELYFVQADGTTLVGNKLILDMSSNTSYPAVANWTADFYTDNTTQPIGGFINTDRPLKFFAGNLSQFGLNSGNYQLAKKLIYKPGGSSDPAFIAYNEPSIGVAQRLLVTSQPTTSDCNGAMSSGFSVRLTDAFENGYVAQAGYIITASMYTGPGALLGTVTATTDATGTATFNNLLFEVGGDHVIKFTNSSLQPGISAVISGPDCTPNIWTGNTNTAWNNTGNWETSSIPNANNNVTIPEGRPNYPVLTANAGAKNLTMGAGATINLNGKLFAIKGDILKEPTAFIQAEATGSELYMTGLALQTIPAGFVSGNIYNFTVENSVGVTTDAELKITNLLNVKLGTFNANGVVTMICSFSPRKTGIIGAVTGTITGQVTTEQCFPARRAYRFISPSVTTTTSIRANWQENATAWNHNPTPGNGTHITGTGAAGSTAAATDGTNGFDWQPSGASSLFMYSNSAQAWSAAGNTLATLVAGAPFRLMIRGSRSTNITLNSAAPSDTKLRTKGTLAQGTISVSGLSVTAGHNNFIGNPYHSVVDMSAVMAALHNLTNFYYIWDPKMGGANPIIGQPGGRGAYVAINTTTGVKNNASSAASIFLQPNQAFFVRTAALGSTPQLAFRESDKVTTALQTNVFRSIDHPFIDLTLYYSDAFESEGTATDGVRIDFSDSGDNLVEENDAPKIGNLDENVARLSGESLIALESRAMPEAGDELPLSVTQYRKSNYVMRIKIGDFENLGVYLVDSYLNQQTLLTNDSESIVNFAVDAAVGASTGAGRFSLLFGDANLGGDEIGNQAGFSIYPNPVTGDVVFINASGSAGAVVEIAVYNTLGQKLLRKLDIFNSNNQIELNTESLASGVYVMKIKSDSRTTNTVKFIKK